MTLHTGREAHLMRTWHRTDADRTDEDGMTDSEYLGAFSATLRVPEGWRLVDVDWSERGMVQVTYLIPGPHHLFLPEPDAT